MSVLETNILPMPMTYVNANYLYETSISLLETDIWPMHFIKLIANVNKFTMNRHLANAFYQTFENSGKSVYQPIRGGMLLHTILLLVLFLA